jgi:hypothetical protein
MSTAAIRAVTDARVREMNAAMAGLSREEQIACLARLLNEDDEMVELNRRLRWPCSWQRMIPMASFEYEAEITITVEPVLAPVPEEEEELDPEIEENTNPSLRIGNLCSASDRKKLMTAIKNVFGKHGEIRDVNMPMDKKTGNPRGFAFIEYRDPRDAMRAFKAERDKKSLATVAAPRRDVTVEMAQSSRKTTEEMAALHGARVEKKGADAATTDA